MKALLEPAARLLLEQYGIPNVPGVFCTNQSELLQVAGKIGFPIVMKIVSPDIIHKSEVGGVRLNICNEKAMFRAYEEMLETVKQRVPEAKIEGVLLTSYIQKAREVIIGAVEDAQFGQVIMFGLGGIFVETYKDVSFGIAPVTKKEAQYMIESIKAYPILNGARGEMPVNFELLKQIIVNLSTLAYECKVKEVDLNPIFCFDDKVVAGDVRILLND